MPSAPSPVERVVQRSVIAYLNTVGITTAHVPNGAMLAGTASQRARQMNALKADGLRVGFPDLILIHSKGRVGFMEVKREGEKLGENQIHWAGSLEYLGHNIALVRSIDDAKDALTKWGWL